MRAPFSRGGRRRGAEVEKPKGGPKPRKAPGGSGVGGRITPADIEAQVRQITGQVGHTIERTTEVVKPKIVPIGAAGGAVVVAATYLLGRRRGRRRSTVVEVRRG